jgi:hypothetical protein
MASSSSSPSSGFKPRIFPDTLKLCTKHTYPGRLIFEAAREGSIPIMKGKVPQLLVVRFWCSWIRCDFWFPFCARRPGAAV